MSIFKTIYLLTITILLLPAAGYTADIVFSLPDSLQDIDFWDEEGEFTGLVAEEACPPDFDLTVIPYIGKAGTQDTFDIKITLPSSGLPWHGGIAFRFPFNFDLSQIEDITYSDDNPGTDPEVKCAFVWYNKMAICFEGGSTPSVGTEVTLTISTIGNPTSAGQYFISGLIFNRHFRVVSGPVWSEWFDIYPADPYAIYIHPDEPLFLTAGTTQLFTVAAVDEYGNELDGFDYTWFFTSESENIGSLDNGELSVTTNGTGQVVVSTGSLADTSGLITVTPSELDYFVFIEYPAVVQSGEPFPSVVTIAAYDSFDNLKYDYNGEVYFMSNDTLAEFFYDTGNSYSFISVDSGQHSFGGSLFSLITMGNQTITITDGIISTTTDSILVVSGTHPASFKLEYDDTVTAGQPMAIRITEAVDSTGESMTTMFDVILIGDGTSPDGYNAIINDVLVLNGAGTAYQYLFKTGQARLGIDSDTGIIEINVEVLPAELSDLSLGIPSTQFIANEFIGSASITAIDLYGNIKTDFDAELSPVTITVSRGEMTPDVLNSTGDFTDGVADLTDIGLMYIGEAGAVQVYVGTDEVTSNWVNLHFNGIIQDILRTLPDTVRTGFKGQFMASLYNPGNLAPYSPITYELYFVSCTDNCTITGTVDSLPVGDSTQVSFLVDITNDLNLNENDTFMVVMRADYVYGDDTYTVSVVHEKPIVVLESVLFEYVENSLSHDTVLSPSNIDKISLQLRPGEGYELDRPRIATHLFVGDGDSEWYELYYSVLSTYQTGDTDIITLSFSNIEVPDLYELGWATERYGYLRMEGSLYDDGWYVMVPLENFDSVMVLYPFELEYSDGSVTPDSAMAGYACQFELDVELTGSPDFVLDRYQSRFELYDNDTLVMVTLLSEAYTLTEGRNHIVTSDIYIPDRFGGSSLTPRLILDGYELYARRVDTVFFNNESISILEHVATTPELRILSADLIAPNPPFLNHGQEFGILVAVENLSDYDVDSISLLILSEDGSDTFSVESDISISGHDGLQMTFMMEAPQTSTSLFVYKAVLAAPEAVTILPPEDNVVGVQVQSPAEIELTYTLNDVYGDFVEYGQIFSIDVRLDNSGEASAGPGQITLITDGVDFGVDDTTSIALETGDVGTWQLTAPSKTVTANLQLLITYIPTDNNTALPAVVNVDSVSITINVGSTASDELVGAVIVSPTPLIIPGESYELLGLEFCNKTGDSLSQIGLKSIILEITDQHGYIIPAEDIVLPATAGFKNDDSIITTAELYGERLRLNFNNFRLYPQVADTIYFFARINPEIKAKGFGVQVDSRDIKAAYVTGPRVNQIVPVTGKFESNFKVLSNFIIVSVGLENSFAVRNNPFNPEQGEAEFAYYLNQDSDVEMTVYTLLGEKVYNKYYSAGSEGGRQGDNNVSWNGCNDEGRMVLNGVYIIVVEAKRTCESYKLKLAVMK